jgi:sterol desaturase/sphingolipid hydroxylase (fatty acid hydroxylase superfamily)
MRLVAFGLITFFFILETYWPYLVHISRRARHTSRNLGLMIFYIFFTAPVNYYGVVWFEFVDKQGYGLLNLVDLPTVVKVVLGIFLLDLGDYFYHRASHRWKPLWGYHRVHHSDPQMDVTTGYRFHPFESLGLLGTQIISSFVFGYGLETVVLYYSLYIPWVIMQHTNLKFPNWFENSFSYVLATPNFHRVHHSYPQSYTDSNYGDFFSIWDRIFGTYQKVEPKQLKFGLEGYEDDRKHTLWYMLTEPFRK